MFSAFRPKAPKAPPPKAEVLSFDGETLEIQCDQPLPQGLQRLLLLHEELELELESELNIDQGFPDKKLYWATCPTGSELPPLLARLIPQVEAAESEDSPPAYEEKRKKARLNRVLGAMSPQVEGFRCVTHDINSDGLRLQLVKPIEADSTMKVRFELEDHRLPPFDVQARVRWCQPNPHKGGFWAGLEFATITAEQQAQIDKFVEEVQSYESGVITRDYAS